MEEVVQWLRDRYPEQTPELYGRKSWPQVLHESGLFDLRREKGSSSNPARHRFRSRPRPSTKRPTEFGTLSGKVHVAADFDAPLPTEVAADFEGEESTAAAIRAAKAGQVTDVKLEDL